MSRSLQSPTYQELRRLLIAARMSAYLTQKQVAERLGRPQSFMSKWESGERHLDVAEFMSLCEAMGTSAVTVLAEVQARTRSPVTFL